jgi:hypothetical protein
MLEATFGANSGCYWLIAIGAPYTAAFYSEFT